MPPLVGGVVVLSGQLVVLEDAHHVVKGRCLHQAPLPVSQSPIAT